MHKKWLFPAVAVGIFAGAGSASALGPVDLGLEVDYVSRYIWRGYDVPGNNRPAVQPSGTVSVTPVDGLDVWYNLWANYQVSEPDSDNEWDELDHTLGVDYAVNDEVSVSVGYIFYQFPTEGDSDLNDTKEVYAGVSVGLPLDLAAALTVYYDHDNGKGIYANLGLEYSRELSEAVGLWLAADVGYMSYSEDEEDGGFYVDSDGDGFRGFSDANLGLGLDVDLGYGVSLSNAVTYTITFDDDINEDNEAWILTALSCEF